MIANKGNLFNQIYEDALKAHLSRKSRGATKSWIARKIGKEAIAQGLNAIDLASIHDQAIRRLRPKDTAATVTGTGDGYVSRSTLFYIEALVPLEQVRKAEQTKLKQFEKELEKQTQREAKRQNKLLEEARSQKEEVRQLTHQFLLAQERERKEISRDLHDEIAQVLAGINVRLAALKKVVQIGGEDISERIDQTQKLVEHSVAAVHRYALRLRPSLLDDLGLIPTLRSYIGTHSEHHGISIQFDVSAEVDSLGNEPCTALYRVAQESLTNVVRHSNAKNAYVKLECRAQRIRLEIRDDGRGFDANRILNSTTQKRLGVLGMRERIEMLNGIFSITSSSSKGTTVVADLPFDNDSSEIT
ncbi:histidine kinase [Puniceicoccaceae bacterium K14]|nr:histidine kinase [Puniceicoccaceae bacterium K14]